MYACFRRSFNAIRSAKPFSKSKKRNLSPSQRRNGENIKDYSTKIDDPLPKLDATKFVRGFLISLGVGAGTASAKIYWNSQRLFEGPQKGYAIPLETTMKYYVQRNTDDVKQIRQEFSPEDTSSHPYTIVWGPERCGKTVLARDSAQQPGVRYSSSTDLRFFMDNSVLDRTKTLWEAITSKYILEFKQWAIKNADRIKVVFVPTHIPDVLLGPEQPKKLSLGGFSNDEAKQFLRNKLEVDKESPNTPQSPKWLRNKGSWQTGPQWTQLTRDEVISEIDTCVDTVTGGDIGTLLKINDITSMDKAVNKMKDTASVGRFVKETAQRILANKGPLPLSKLDREPSTSVLRINEIDRTIDFAAPGYRNAFEELRRNEVKY